ncbi:Uncharacterized protein BM_BM18115 [Brugia malayi]|uniref:Uncharacterized protein n=1 Tax=Brugia malayi TaxID=6279 RepID=A0A4E9EVU3_BRUMA|nr:Uncharacterized protein BM_BM18115 [Brugia malayi]VIO88008.1 Uncharacterized protein BM_BM18115 [Brugia malayi]
MGPVWIRESISIKDNEINDLNHQERKPTLFYKETGQRNANVGLRCHTFRLSFAQSGVFSANMLDRLLYQAHVKNYVVHFVRLFLGIDQSRSSGYLIVLASHQVSLNSPERLDLPVVYKGTLFRFSLASEKETGPRELSCSKT